MFGYRYRYVFILLLGLYSYVNIIFTGGDQLFGFTLPTALFVGIVVLLVLLVWEVNHFIQKQLDFLSGVFRQKIHPLIIHFALSLVGVCVVAVLPVLLLHEFYDVGKPLTWLPIKIALGFSFRINLFLHCLNAIVFYMNKYKRAQLQAEVLKKQSIEARFDALRNQINPHFLFNSFNVLSTLVYKDADTAARFIDQLSNVYRYLLYNQDQKLIRLKEELDFIESYLFLLKIRFQENLRVINDIPEEKKETYIAPATLQLLIENAIKHNVVSKKDPLEIRLFVENGTPEVNKLVVENNLQPKAVKEESSKLGLRNIQSRYEFLVGQRAVEVIQDTRFTVKIPLLKIHPELPDA
ncbi:MAG: histidine kinase [Cyclobacteriaceae bacterium]|jgi:sensor histidine kinase YesM|nr:histidine kinase [Cyclobacteriaceae bacterium]